MIYPDYGRSILSTTSSILRHYGADNLYPTLPELDALLETKPKHVALIITDGAGVKPLEGALAPDSFMRSHVGAIITSIYPSTTTAATTSYYNGKSAYEHGWLGWQLYFKEYATDVTTFMRTTFYTHKEVDGPQPAPYIMPYETVFDMIKKSSPDVKTRTMYAFDSYCEHGSDEQIRVSDFHDICARLADISRSSEETYTIAYWGEPDTTMHAKGVGSKEAIEKFRQIDAELKALAGKLTDTLLIVTADHGLINSESIDIDKMPDLMECLIMPPMVESRAAAFYVKPHLRARFERVFAEKLGQWFLLLSREDIYRTGIFGRGKAHPKFDDFIGDYMALAISNKNVRYTLPGAEPYALIGMHAGLTEDEMLVPVIMTRT